MKFWRLSEVFLKIRLLDGQLNYLWGLRRRLSDERVKYRNLPEWDYQKVKACGKKMHDVSRKRNGSLWHSVLFKVVFALLTFIWLVFKLRHSLFKGMLSCETVLKWVRFYLIAPAPLNTNSQHTHTQYTLKVLCRSLTFFKTWFWDHWARH